IDLHAKYDEAGPRARVARRATGSIDLHDVALGTPRVEAVWTRKLSIARFNLDMERRTLGLGAIRARGTEAWIRRDRAHGPLDLPAGGQSGAWTLTVARADAVDGLLHVVGTRSAESVDVRLSEAHLGRLAALDSATPFSFVAALATGGTASAEGELVRAP